MLGRLKGDISKVYTNNTGVPVELEVRFGKFINQRFDAGVSLDAFKRVKTFFTNLGLTSIRIHSVDDFDGNIRKSQIDGDKTQVIWLRKINKWKNDLDDYDVGLRFSMSTEEEIAPITNFKSTYQRVKDRLSFDLYGGNIRLDLTTVMAKSTIFEVEIELLNKESFKDFENTINIVLKLILDTNILYNAKQSAQVLRDLNICLNGKNPNILDPNMLVQARNLKLKDMVDGGLIGNKIKTSKEYDGRTFTYKNNPYSVTHKADGVRKLLFFHQSGIWYVAPKRFLNLIVNINLAGYNGTILDGEDIPTDKRKSNAPTTKYWYLAFDCMSVKGNPNIQNQNLMERLKFAQTATKAINELTYKDVRLKIISAQTKEFRGFNTPDEFYKIMDSMFAQQKLLSYEQDGFLFTPIETKYNPHSERFPLYQRVLTRHPDICKWKRKEDLTIDFELQWGKINMDGSRNLTLLSRKNYPEFGSIPFRGTRFNPFDTSMIDVYNELTLDLPSGTIVEYAWNFDKNVLYPVRTRPDKTGANRLDVAEDNWDWIFNPVTEKTLTGDNFDLVYAYHNRIKKALFKYGSGQTLLDIGSGRGGDVHRWAQYSKIVAVEPNPEHIVELKRRIDLNGMTDKVKIVQAGGEDTKIISKAVKDFIGGSVDVISMMLSLSFFWKDNSTYDGLINTITKNLKPNGKFIFLTIDGDAVQQTFDPIFNGPQIKQLTLGKSTFDYKPPRLIIDFPDTIVEKQIEWLVRIGDLISSFNKKGYKLVEVSRSDKEKFLSPEEMIYTKMYSYGAFAKSDVEIPEVTPFIPVTTEVIKMPKVIAMSPRKYPEPESIIETQPQLPQIPKQAELVQDPTQQLSEIPKQAELVQDPTQQLPQIGSVIEIKTEQLNPIKLKLVEKPLMVGPQLLNMLYVSRPMNENDEGVGTDVSEDIVVDFYDNVVRIAAIGDGSCFFHSVLLSYYKPYQDNPSYKFRSELVKMLRRDLAIYLTTPSPIPPTKQIKESMEEIAKIKNVEVPEARVYDTLNDGAFLDHYLFEIRDGLIETDEAGVKLDYSLEGMQQLLNSSRDVGVEVYQYVADILGVNVFVMRGYTDKIEMITNTLKEETMDRPCVVILGNEIHYEVVGVKTKVGIQTMFFTDDPFIKAIENKFLKK
jgi:SAM-dependent methyltransferase